MTQQLVLNAISKQLEEKVMRNSQHGFIKGKSGSTNIIAFYDGITGWVNERKAADVVYVDFSKAFDIVSCIVLITKLSKCGIDE